MCDGFTSEERDCIKALEREVKELRRANEILKLASAFSAQTLKSNSTCSFMKDMIHSRDLAIFC